MHKPTISVIQLDMDGVIADFDKRYLELYGMTPEVAEKSKKFAPLFKEFIATQQFATLDIMEGSMEGINFLRSLTIPTEILTSTARPENHENIMAQKKIWLDTYNITFKQNFVPGKKLKKNFATPTSILIDDTESNIDDWIGAGGIGILHKDWGTTLQILKMYV